MYEMEQLEAAADREIASCEREIDKLRARAGDLTSELAELKSEVERLRKFEPPACDQCGKPRVRIAEMVVCKDCK